MYRFYFAVFLIILLFDTTSIHAQESVSSTDESISESDTLFVEKELKSKFVDLSYNILYPVNTFGDLLDKNLKGFSVSYLWERKSSNYDFFGIRVTYNHLGSIKNSFIGTSPGGAFDIEETTSSNLWSTHFLYRIYPNFYFWRIEPFIEASLGTNMFITSTSTIYFDEESSSEFDFNAFNAGLSYGLNIGFTLHLTNKFFFLWQLGYYSGNNTTYMVEGDNGAAIPLNNFNSETSQTNSLQLKLGLTYSFY